MLSQVKAGDSESWDRLVDLYGRLVYWWCRSKGVDEQGASDIGQEVFLSVYKHIANFERVQARDSFRGWLRKITNSKVADYYRERMIQPIAEGGSTAVQKIHEVPAPADEDDDESVSQEKQILYAAILDLIRGEFSDTDWNAFRKTVIEDQSPNEVAAELGISRNQVYLAKSRILHRIRLRFGSDLEIDRTIA